MCILFIYVNPDAAKGRYRLIIASNRDEYYQRPAEPASLCEESQVAGGRDMEKGREGGMWFGVSLKRTSEYVFRAGALLNLTGEERKQGVEGRGPIVSNYLNGNLTARDYVTNLQSKGSHYNAFNFVAVELSNTESVVYHQSNIQNACTVYKGKQILGFGNSSVTIPLQKVLNGKGRFAAIVNSFDDTQQKQKLIDELLNLLKLEDRHLPDLELQRRSPQAFEYLSAIFVKIEAAGYGTRTHSLVLIDSDWNSEFIEITMKEPIDVKSPVWETTNIKARL